ncbi:tumor necrosis factor ligand superfamily member 4 isoform X1 [Myiozetetes cayanensis]|uniref:tumor necrosis factor ligand superfamily member 4 isoform X1 n=1 Tax=Myiozetetes cayanensis TaxID=478635 RepID=UPI00215F65DD|nr:tumor necrosis factor ligand superfamily member 4 isoform X1 [Myiozetetes cayanensis]
MEVQPEAEPRNEEQMDCKRECAEDEWKSWQRGQVRNTLHLVSAVAQWILLLACLIYLGIDFLQPSTPQSIEVPWTHIRYSGKSIKGVAINLTAERGSIQIRNGSIMIPCDGLYLVSLNGSIYPEEKLLKLTLKNTQKSTSSVLWIQTVQSSDDTVNLTTVFFLFRDDYVTLCTSSNANISGLSLSLVLVSPPEETLCRS